MAAIEWERRLLQSVRPMTIPIPRLTLSRRLALQAVSIAVLLLSLGEAGLVFHYRQMTADRVQALRSVAELFQSYAGALDKRVASGAMTRDAAFDGTRRDHDGDALQRRGGLRRDLHDGRRDARRRPTRKMVGQNRMDVATGGVKIIRSITDLLKNADTATFAYNYTRPGREGLFPKVTVAVRYKPWNLLILAGAYTDDIDAGLLVRGAGGLRSDPGPIWARRPVLRPDRAQASPDRSAGSACGCARSPTAISPAGGRARPPRRSRAHGRDGRGVPASAPGQARDGCGCRARGRRQGPARPADRCVDPAVRDQRRATDAGRLGGGHRDGGDGPGR